MVPLRLVRIWLLLASTRSKAQRILQLPPFSSLIDTTLTYVAIYVHYGWGYGTGFNSEWLEQANLPVSLRVLCSNHHQHVDIRHLRQGISTCQQTGTETSLPSYTNNYTSNNHMRIKKCFVSHRYRTWQEFSKETVHLHNMWFYLR